MTMQLYGSNLSPYTRRVTLALTLAGQDFELVTKMTGPDEAELRAHNPLGRLPFLRVDANQTLIDSMTILRWLDQQTDQFRPSDPAADLVCEETMALANGVCEKAMASFYERTRRPEEYCYPGWVERCAWQVTDGLSHLNDRFAAASPYLFGDHLTYADLFAFVAAQFVKKTCPNLNADGTYANLETLEQHLEARNPIFTDTRP